MKNLEHLDIGDCKIHYFGLDIFENLKSLKYLYLTNVKGLNTNLYGLISLEEFSIYGVNNLEIVDLSRSKGLIDAHFENCKELSVIIFCRKTSLGELTLIECPKVEEIKNLANVAGLYIDSRLLNTFTSGPDSFYQSLVSLDIHKKDNIEINDLQLSKFVDVQSLVVNDFNELISPFKSIKKLEELRASSCTKLHKDAVKHLKHLTLLAVHNCINMDDNSFKELTNLTELYVVGCTQLRNPFAGLAKLEELHVNECINLQNNALIELINLKNLECMDCIQLTDKSFNGLVNLEEIDVTGCVSLIKPFDDMKELRIITAIRCKLDREAFKNTIHLQKLDISEHKYTTGKFYVTDFKHLKSLTELYCDCLYYKIDGEDTYLDPDNTLLWHELLPPSVYIYDREE